jgi:radical SAM protein with 4Fe4S-binding SPASM domain
MSLLFTIKVENMELKLNTYPMLEDHISASEVITSQGSELLIYNTVTGMKTYPNEATFNFLGLATGTAPFGQIMTTLSQQSGEPPEEIWPGLSTLVDKMVKNGLLKILQSPVENPRAPPPSVELVHRLESVSFETTRTCNLRCRHCYSDSGTQLGDELTVEEIKALIDHLADMGVLAITFTGGEPLMHPHIFELMEYAKKKPLTLLLFTNATLITPKVVEKLKELQIYKVNVSIDGPDSKTHDRFRGVDGAFKKTIRGVNLLREAGIAVQTSISVTKLNYKKVKETLHLVKDLGITSFKLWPITFSGRPGHKNMFVTPEEFREVMEALREFEFEELGKKKKEIFEYSKKRENCGIGSGTLAIKSNGVVTPCPAFGDDVSLGNVRTHSVADIWNNSLLLNELRAMSVYKTEVCKDCTFAAVCKGGCIADIYGGTGKFSCYNPYMCVAFDVTKDDFIPVEVEDTRSHSLSVEMA